MARTVNAGGRGARALSADDELSNRIFFRLLQAENIYARKAQQEMGFSAIQGALLGALSEEPERGIRLSELVDYLSVSRQNLDGVIRRLEKPGYVERIEDETNRRIKRVRLTTAGMEAWQALLSESLEFYRQAVDGISSEERQAFAETLIRIIRGLRRVRIERPRSPQAIPRAQRGRRRADLESSEA